MPPDIMDCLFACLFTAGEKSTAGETVKTKSTAGEKLSIHMHILHITHICAYSQVRGLLDTLQLLASDQGEGHLRMYSTLLIGHRIYAGEQRVACWPFKGKTLQKSNRQDLVFARPAGIDKGGFQLRIDNSLDCHCHGPGLGPA